MAGTLDSAAAPSEAELDAERFGFSDADRAALKQHLAGGQTDDGVWAENVDVVTAFLAASTQWRTASIGGGFAPSRIMYLGLDYAAARIGIEMAGIAVTPSLWNGLRVMEAEACSALNEARP